jgi:hypothetical protein
MRKLRPSSVVDISSDRIVILDPSTRLSNAEIVALTTRGYIVRVQAAGAAQDKSPDEKSRPRNRA